MHSCGARLSTAGLLAILGMLNRRWYWGFLALLMLDIFSHWFQMYATMAAGASTHKVGSCASAGFNGNVHRFTARKSATTHLVVPCSNVLHQDKPVLVQAHHMLAAC